MAKSGCSAAWLARLNGVQEVVGSNPATPTILILYEFRERQACSFPQSYVDRHVSIQKGTKKSSCGNRRNQKTPALSPPFARGDTGGCKKTFPKKKFLKGNTIY